MADSAEYVQNQHKKHQNIIIAVVSLDMPLHFMEDLTG